MRSVRQGDLHAQTYLITGASFAGNTAAAVLADHDFEVVVVEQAEAFCDGGQNVDVRGVGARYFAG